MFKLLKKLVDWFENAPQRDRDAYLSQATNIYDLENRMRQFDGQRN
jgi:hypothetical protein